MKAKDGVGRYGERVAAQHLVDAGMQIVELNWRCRDGEIDIVARDGDTVVFCEVKTRSSMAYGDPAEAVVGAKAARLRRLAVRWLAEHPHAWTEIRIDVVSVLRQRQGAAVVRHIRAVS